MPFSEYVSSGGSPHIIFDYDSVLRYALKSLGLELKATKKRGHVLAGVKIVDCDAINPNDSTRMMDDGSNAQANEELTCIPLHFVNTKEFHALFVTDLKSFFDFAKRCRDVGLLSRKPGKSTLVPFK